MTVQEWFKNLSLSEKELVAIVLNDLSTSCSLNRIRRLEDELNAVKARIDACNQRREALQTQADNISGFLDLLYRDNKQKSANLTLSLLSVFLTDRLSQLRAEINSLRPTEDLKLKHDLSVKIEHLYKMRQVIQILGDELKWPVSRDAS